MKGRHSLIAVAAGSASLLAACGTGGDTRAVKDTYALAIECRTVEALAAADRAARGGGLGAELGDLQRVVILRDAGRMAEANTALAERNRRVHADARAAAEAEHAVNKNVDELRAERQRKTGRRTCP